MDTKSIYIITLQGRAKNPSVLNKDLINPNFLAWLKAHLGQNALADTMILSRFELLLRNKKELDRMLLSCPQMYHTTIKNIIIKKEKLNEVQAFLSEDFITWLKSEDCLDLEDNTPIDEAVYILRQKLSGVKISQNENALRVKCPQKYLTELSNLIDASKDLNIAIKYISTNLLYWLKQYLTGSYINNVDVILQSLMDVITVQRADISISYLEKHCPRQHLQEFKDLVNYMRTNNYVGFAIPYKIFNTIKDAEMEYDKLLNLSIQERVELIQQEINKKNLKINLRTINRNDIQVSITKIDYDHHNMLKPGFNAPDTNTYVFITAINYRKYDEVEKQIREVKERLEKVCGLKIIESFMNTKENYIQSLDEYRAIDKNVIRLNFSNIEKCKYVLILNLAEKRNYDLVSYTYIEALHAKELGIPVKILYPYIDLVQDESGKIKPDIRTGWWSEALYDLYRKDETAELEVLNGDLSIFQE